MGKKSSAKKAIKETPTEAPIEAPKKTVLEKPESQEPRMREIIIQTNGNDIRITKNETAGQLELLAVLQALIGSLTSSKR